jgi:hypothetical protein
MHLTCAIMTRDGSNTKLCVHHKHTIRRIACAWDIYLRDARHRHCLAPCIGKKRLYGCINIRVLLFYGRPQIMDTSSTDMQHCTYLGKTRHTTSFLSHQALSSSWFNINTRSSWYNSNTRSSWYNSNTHTHTHSLSLSTYFRLGSHQGKQDLRKYIPLASKLHGLAQPSKQAQPFCESVLA